MIGNADVELMVTERLRSRLGGRKLWADPELPENWNFTAPIGHVQRGQDASGSSLSLEVALFDISWYAATADHARAAAVEAHIEMVLNLPLYTWPNGVMCMSVQVAMAPAWLPDPSAYRRGASYRVYFHGFVAP